MLLKLPSISEIVSFHKNHDSISKIKGNSILQKKNCFKEISPNEVKKIIKIRNKKKSVVNCCIPAGILIDSMDIYLPLPTDIINNSMKNSTFFNQLTLSEVIPLFKKVDSFDKTNCRPVILLSHLSKASVRIIYNQIDGYIEPLSNLMAGFGKNHNTLHSLLKKLKKSKETLDRSESVLVSAIFMCYLSKAFDTLTRDLLIAKLETTGFSAKSFSYIHRYLNKRS